MRIRYINNERIGKSMKKFKLFVSFYVLCGVLNLIGCESNNLDVNIGEKTSMIEDDNVKNGEQMPIYFSQLIFSNLDYLSGDEKDVVGAYDKDGNIYTGFYISKGEKNHRFIVPVQDFIVSSKMLGMVEVHLEANEEAIVYIDYLNKTISLEKKEAVNKKIVR